MPWYYRMARRPTGDDEEPWEYGVVEYYDLEDYGTGWTGFITPTSCEGPKELLQVVMDMLKDLSAGVERGDEIIELEE